MKNIFILAVLLSFSLSACEQLAEEDTPVCKDCYGIRYHSTTNAIIDTPDFNRLCGGDVIAWQNFSDSIGDSTVIKYSCK